MKKIFLDANVLVSVLNKEYPLYPQAARILSLADRQGYSLYTSPICLAITYYFVEKKSGNKMARQKIGLLMKHLNITTVDNTTIQKTLDNPEILDFEDGMEYYSSLESKCQCIITENTSDFHFSIIPIMTCTEFINAK